MISDHDKVVAGQTFRLGIHLEQDPEWHTYWKSPGVVGKPTVINWKLPEGVTASPYQYPAPAYFEQSGLVSIGYEDEVLLFSDVTIPKDMPAGPTVLRQMWNGLSVKRVVYRVLRNSLYHLWLLILKIFLLLSI